MDMAFTRNRRGSGNSYRCRGPFSPLGIDLGSARIKVIQLRLKRGRIIVHNMAAADTPGGSLQGGRVSNPGLLAEKLRELRSEHRWYRNKAVFCLDDPLCKLKKVTMPPMSPRDTARAMRWQAEKNFSKTMGPVNYDYFSLNSRVGHQMEPCDYLLAAVKKEDADAMIDAAVSSGFYPAGLEIKSLALLRSLYFSRPLLAHGENGLKILVDIGFSSTLVLATLNGSFHFSQSIHHGIADFYRTLLSAPDHHINLAHCKIHSRSSLEQRGLLDPCRRLADQVISAINSKTGIPDRPGRGQSHLLLCGGGTLIPGLAAYIGGRIAMHAHLHDPLRFINESSLEGIYYPKSPGTIFAQATGLALRGWIK